MNKGLSSKIGSFVSLPLATLLVIFFFLPWVELTCDSPMGNKRMATASGWELTRGELSEEKDGNMVGGGSMRSAAGNTSGKPQKSAEPKEKKEMDEAIDARPLFIAGLIVPAVALLVGLLSVSGSMKPAQAGMALVVLGILGLIVMVMAANVDFSDEIMSFQEKENKAKAQAPPPATQGAGPSGAMGQAMGNAMAESMKKDMKKYLKTSALGIAWTCLAFYILLAGCGAANVALSGKSGGASGSGGIERQASGDSATPESVTLPPPDINVQPPATHGTGGSFDTPPTPPAI